MEHAASFETICDSADREHWLAERRNGIGSSDAASVLRLNPWRSPLQLYAEKLGLEEPGEQSEAAYWGTILEPLVLNRFAHETGRACRRNGMLVRSIAHPWQLATVDGDQVDAKRGQGILEIKCTSLAENWEDGPPPYVTAQVQHQLSVTGARWGSVAVLFNGREFAYRDFERDEEMIGWLVETEREFMRRLWALEPPEPEGTERDKRAIAKLFPKDIDPEPVVLGGEFVELDERRAELRLNQLEFEHELVEIENRFRLAIGEHAAAILPSGVIYTLKLQKRDAYTVPAGQFRALRRKERK